VLYGLTTQDVPNKFAFYQLSDDLLIFSRYFSKPNDVVKDVTKFKEMAVVVLPDRIEVFSYLADQQYELSGGASYQPNKVTACDVINGIIVNSGKAETGFSLDFFDVSNLKAPVLSNSTKYDTDFSLKVGVYYDFPILIILKQTMIEEYLFAENNVASGFKHRNYPMADYQFNPSATKNFAFNPLYGFLYVLG